MEAEIERVIEEDLPDEIANRNDALRIGTATPLLMLTDQTDRSKEQSAEAILPTVMDQLTIEKVFAKAKANMEERSTYLKELAAKKQEVHIEMMKFGDIKELTEPDYTKSGHILLVVQDREDAEELQFMMGFEFDGNGGEAGLHTESLAQGGKPYPEVLEALKLEQPNVYVLSRNNHIRVDDVLMEAMGAINIINDKWEEQNNKLQARSPADDFGTPSV